MRKAQITIFATLGLVLVMIVSLILFMFKDISTKDLEIQLDDDIKFQKYYKIGETYLKYCIDFQLRELLDNLFSNVFIEVYVNDGPSAYVNGESFVLENYFSGVMDIYEGLAQTIVENSYCLNNIPKEMPFLIVNASNTLVEFDVSDALFVRTYLDATVEYKDIIGRIDKIQKNYGVLYARDFNQTFRQIVESFTSCGSGFCLPNIMFSMPLEMKVKTSRITNNLYYITIERDGTFIDNQEIQLNMRVHT
ncbi:MAG: hypothetical protein H8D38_05785 [DPANN group archaeon]|nr:hypothetical protein [DPANN group archaeon]